MEDSKADYCEGEVEPDDDGVSVIVDAHSTVVPQSCPMSHKFDDSTAQSLSLLHDLSACLSQ
jgi:hypothetical protein